jgi:hypothetical protein
MNASVGARSLVQAIAALGAATPLYECSELSGSASLPLLSLRQRRER